MPRDRVMQELERLRRKHGPQLLTPDDMKHNLKWMSGRKA